MRAIDADKLYFAQRYARVDPDSDRLTPVLAVDKYQIENAPTLDVEPVVRCKKCENFDPNNEFCNFWGDVRHPEHFCGEGVRRNDNG